MKVLVVSGFLGAGKTTFIAELARQSGREFVILENEFGAPGIDRAALEQSEAAPRLEIRELSEGCICCSMQSDFASAVLTVANTLRPDYLIVEPSGAGYLSAVLRNLRQIAYERIVLLAPVTILDGRSFRQSLRDFPELCRDQIACAGTVLLSKTESAAPEELSALGAELRALNPKGEICTGHYRSFPRSWWEGLLRRTDSGVLPASAADRESLEEFSLSGAALSRPEELLLLLDAAVSGVFGSVCRAKGYVPAGGAWFRFDAVGPDYCVTGAEPQEKSSLVFIGRGLRRELLRELPGAVRPPHRQRRAGERSLPFPRGSRA